MRLTIHAVHLSSMYARTCNTCVAVFASFSSVLGAYFHVICLVSQDGRTALMLAAERRHVGVVDLLIEHDAQVELKDEVTERLRGVFRTIRV